MLIVLTGVCLWLVARRYDPLAKLLSPDGCSDL